MFTNQIFFKDLFLTELPTFMNDILKFDIKSVSSLNFKDKISNKIKILSCF